MTLELERVLGRELSMTLINQGPTFAAFCATLRTNAPMGYSPLVVLKAGSHATPLFMIHGVGGGVMELFPLARKLTWPGPVIGIQARGLDGRDGPRKTVAAMADDYWRAIKSRQPQGPYFLSGYSFGGLVTFELVRWLRQRGDEVAFGGLLATPAPGHHFLRLWTWTAYLYRSLAQSAIDLGSRATRPMQYRKLTTTRRFSAPGIHAPAGARAVAASALLASAIYRPGNYDGQLTVFEPRIRDLGAPSSALLWGKHATSLQRHTLPGRHDDMLPGDNAEAAARQLIRCLEMVIVSPL